MTLSPFLASASPSKPSASGAESIADFMKWILGVAAGIVQIVDKRLI